MMTFASSPEPPTKKRRFFVDDSPVQDHAFAGEVSLPDEINALPEANVSSTPPVPLLTKENNDGFDSDLLQVIIGEQLPQATISALQAVSGGDIQRGRAPVLSPIAANVADVP